MLLWQNHSDSSHVCWWSFQTTVILIHVLIRRETQTVTKVNIYRLLYGRAPMTISNLFC